MKQPEANISPVINARTFLPVIVVVILQIYTIEQKQAKCYAKISGSSAATKCDVMLYLCFTE